MPPGDCCCVIQTNGLINQLFTVVVLYPVEPVLRNELSCTWFRFDRRPHPTVVFSAQLHVPHISHAILTPSTLIRYIVRLLLSDAGCPSPERFRHRQRRQRCCDLFIIFTVYFFLPAYLMQPATHS